MSNQDLDLRDKLPEIFGYLELGKEFDLFREKYPGNVPVNILMTPQQETQYLTLLPSGFPPQEQLWYRGVPIKVIQDEA